MGIIESLQGVKHGLVPSDVCSTSSLKAQHDEAWWPHWLLCPVAMICAGSPATEWNCLVWLMNLKKSEKKRKILGHVTVIATLSQASILKGLWWLDRRAAHGFNTSEVMNLQVATHLPFSEKKYFSRKAASVTFIFHQRNSNLLCHNARCLCHFDWKLSI